MEWASHSHLFVRASKCLPLTGQFCGHQLKYRVIGVNKGGQSVPSNTAAVVLGEAGFFLLGNEEKGMLSKSLLSKIESL